MKGHEGYHSDTPSVANGPKMNIKRVFFTVQHQKYFQTRKIISIADTRCHLKLLKLKCTKFNFGWGSTPDLVRGAYNAPPDPLAGF